jgi:hypothetical protein
MPSATQMAAAKHCPWMTAATEHNPEVPLLQSTEMSANTELRTQSASCHIEVQGRGSSFTPWTETDACLLRRPIVHDWNNLMEEVRETGLDSGNVKVSHIVCQNRLYDQIRQAQATADVGKPFRYDDDDVEVAPHALMAIRLPKPNSGPGDVTVDVINVHAPSPSKKKLTDQQRKTLLTNLLQSNSKSMPGRAIGKARFLIGGDMNTRHEHFTLSTPLCQPATE